MSGLGLLTRALDAPAAAPADRTSDRILDAALTVAAAVGMQRLTMDEVARRARVGRMTVYRRFGDREGLVEALAIRETRRCLAALDAATDPHQPIADQVAEGFVTSIRIAAEHPILARAARVEAESVLDALNGGAFAAAVAFLADRLRRAQAAGVLAAGDVDASAELLVRIALSFALVPGGLGQAGEERLRAIAREHLVPLLGTT